MRNGFFTTVAMCLAVLTSGRAADLPNSTFADPLGSTAAKNEDGIARALNEEQTLESAGACSRQGICQRPTRRSCAISGGRFFWMDEISLKPSGSSTLR